MPNPRLAARYAKSITDLAVETDTLDTVFDNMILLDEACRNSRELVNFFKSPVINAGKKEKIFLAIFKDQLAEITQKFVILLIKKGREAFLPEIALAVIRRYRQIKNIREVKLTTTFPLSKELTSEILTKIKHEIPNQQIDLATENNQNLIGGFVLETNNTVFDASIARKLKEIKKEFTKNIYISKI